MKKVYTGNCPSCSQYISHVVMASHRILQTRNGAPGLTSRRRTVCRELNPVVWFELEDWKNTCCVRPVRQAPVRPIPQYPSTTKCSLLRHRQNRSLKMCCKTFIKQDRLLTASHLVLVLHCICTIFISYYTIFARICTARHRLRYWLHCTA